MNASRSLKLGLILAIGFSIAPARGEEEQPAEIDREALAEQMAEARGKGLAG